MATKKEIEIKLKSTLDGKGVEEAKQKIDSLNKSTEQLDKDSQQATRSVKNMGQGMPCRLPISWMTCNTASRAS